MIKDANVTRVECPRCGNRLCDKEKEASGPVRQKCQRCKRVWRVELGTNKFTLLK